MKKKLESRDVLIALTLLSLIGVWLLSLISISVWIFVENHKIPFSDSLALNKAYEVGFRTSEQIHYCSNGSNPIDVDLRLSCLGFKEELR